MNRSDHLRSNRLPPPRRARALDLADPDKVRLKPDPTWRKVDKVRLKPDPTWRKVD